MKAVKAAICIAMIFLILALAPYSGFSYAENITAGGYAYADIDGPAYFCTEKRAETAVFAIPQTYCVQVLSVDGDWLYVRYAEDDGFYRALYGYCKNENLIHSQTPPENVYLNYPMTVIYKAGNGTDLLPGLGDIEVQVAYYGEYVVGNQSYLYVLYNGKFGYITDDVPSFPLNDLPSAPTFNPSDDAPDKTTLIVALLITAIAAIAIVVLYFSGKRKIKPN